MLANHVASLIARPLIHRRRVPGLQRGEIRLAGLISRIRLPALGAEQIGGRHQAAEELPRLPPTPYCKQPLCQLALKPAEVKTMMEVGAFEAKNKLANLLDRVEAGEEIVITRRGRPVARLVRPEGGFDRQRARETSTRIWEMGATATLGPDLTVKDIVDGGRKFEPRARHALDKELVDAGR